MKHLLLLALSIFTLQMTAQDKTTSREAYTKNRTALNPEDQAALQVKRMTLKLDLTTEQQKEMKTLFLKEAKSRQAQKEAWMSKDPKAEKSKLTQEQRLKMKHEQLDRQIARKQELKQILNSEQYAKWEQHKNEYSKKHLKKDSRRHHKSDKRKQKTKS